MLSRTNNTRPQSAQQSPIVYSCHSFHRFPNPQAHMVTPTRKPNAMGKAAKTHFEEYGLCVPLLKLGQKRLHARSVGELASKSREGLKVIVKAYADRQASKIIKTLVSKTALAEWIERVETLALGPHPESKLPCKFIDYGCRFMLTFAKRQTRQKLSKYLASRLHSRKQRIGKLRGKLQAEGPVRRRRLRMRHSIHRLPNQKHHKSRTRSNQQRDLKR